MQIETQTKTPHEVTDWNFTSLHGLPMSITVDPETGDTVYVDTANSRIEFHIGERPSPIDPEVTVLAEDITIFCANFLGVRRQKRMVQEVSPEQREEWQRAVVELTREAAPKKI